MHKNQKRSRLEEQDSLEGRYKSQVFDPGIDYYLWVIIPHRSFPTEKHAAPLRKAGKERDTVKVRLT